MLHLREELFFLSHMVRERERETETWSVQAAQLVPQGLIYTKEVLSLVNT